MHYIIHDLAEAVGMLGRTTLENKMKVFLGGTRNESTWRNRIIPMLEVGYFNPVVDDWTPECMAEELRQREECDVCLYVITPKMTGVYSIAEVIDDSNKRPARTVFVRLRDDGNEKFTESQWKSLGAVAQMIARNGGTAFTSLKSAAIHINALPPPTTEIIHDLTDSKVVPAPTAYRYIDASGTHFTEDFNDIQDTPGIEEWTALYEQAQK